MGFRVITYNIHKCIGGVDRRYNPERVAEVLAHYKPDLVLLQEVDRGAKRSRGDHQTEILGDLLGMRHRIWYPNVKVRNGGAYGNAILSRFPIGDNSNIDLSIPMKKRRSVLHARIRIRFGDGKTRTVHIFNLHLGLSGLERKMQLRKFLDSSPFVGLHRRTPVLVAGDFNDVWGTLGTSMLIPAGFRGPWQPVASFPAWAPLRALDSTYVRGEVAIARTFGGKIKVARAASDHLPLVTDLYIDPSSGS